MFSPNVKAIAAFQWTAPEICTRPETKLLADIYWWGSRDDAIAQIRALQERFELTTPKAESQEVWFCLALSALSVGDEALAASFSQRLLVDTPLCDWLILERQGRRRQYQLQAKTLQGFLKKSDVLQDWMITACFNSLNHSGIDPKPLLSILHRRVCSSDLQAMLMVRLLAAAGKVEQATSLLQQSRTIWPLSAPLAWLNAMICVQIGQLDAAVKAAREAEQLGLVDMGTLRLLFSSRTPADRNLYERLSPYVKGNARQLAELASYLIIQHWINGDLHAAHALLTEHHAFQQMEERDEDKAAQVFMRYAVFLCVAWQHNQASYSGPFERRLAVFGESHSLTSARIVFPWCGHQVKGTTHFVIGIKMWSLATKKNNKWAAGLAAELAAMQPDQDILMTIGEIDCRPDEGLWPTHKRTGRPLQQLIDRTVDGYLNWLGEHFAGKQLGSITIQGVPAPGYNFEKKLPEGSSPDKFLKMFVAVNDALRAGVLKRGWFFLDVYAATVGEDGRGNKKWHLDGYHLQPIFYLQAQNWLLKPEPSVKSL